MKQPSTGSFSHTGSCAWSGRVASFLGPWRYLAAQHSRDFRHYRGEHDFWQRYAGVRAMHAEARWHVRVTGMHVRALAHAKGMFSPSPLSYVSIPS